MGVVVPGPIGKNGGVQQFSAAGAFPGIKRTDKIIKFLCEHTAFATWTMHGTPPATGIKWKQSGYLHHTCQLSRQFQVRNNKNK
jgi:hypothetical protein